jgi:hypothetical protein
MSGHLAENVILITLFQRKTTHNGQHDDEDNDKYIKKKKIANPPQL